MLWRILGMIFFSFLFKTLFSALYLISAIFTEILQRENSRLYSKMKVFWRCSIFIPPYMLIKAQNLSTPHRVSGLKLYRARKNTVSCKVKNVTERFFLTLVLRRGLLQPPKIFLKSTFLPNKLRHTRL